MSSQTKSIKTENTINSSNVTRSKHSTIIEKTYKNNLDSDYTEKIDTLRKGFNYQSNSEHYWGSPIFSTLYGTPLYDVASPSQKLALNHLYWVGQYSHTANSEANTMLYNQVTSGVFEKIRGYDTLCAELNFETDQERYHINTFQKVGYQTKLALLGKDKSSRSARHLSKPSLNGSISSAMRKLRVTKNNQTSLEDSIIRNCIKFLYRNKKPYYSQYLMDREDKPIPATSGGLAGYAGSSSLIKLFTMNWGSSPFMACHYYTLRMIANMSLKTYESQYFKHFRDLEKKGEVIPVPTQISYYHMLDEAFHTTLSKILAQDVYKDFSAPTASETVMANTILLKAQYGILGGLSAWLPATFRNDGDFLPSLYRLLRSPLFNFSHKDTLHWMEKCLCQEHQGFHDNLKHHHGLLNNFRKFFGQLDYLWPVNREVQVMSSGGSIEKAIKKNQKALVDFSNKMQSV